MSKLHRKYKDYLKKLERVGYFDKREKSYKEIMQKKTFA